MRSKAVRARSRRRDQSFAAASELAPSGSSAASRTSARRRSRSLGADSSGHVRAESGRRRVARCTSRVVEQRRDVLPERARLSRNPLVAGRLADEYETLRRARAGRVEEVAVASDLIRSLEAAAQLAPELVAQEAATAACGAGTRPPRAPARRRRRTTGCEHVRGRARRRTPAPGSREELACARAPRTDPPS